MRIQFDAKCLTGTTTVVSALAVFDSDKTAVPSVVKQYTDILNEETNINQYHAIMVGYLNVLDYIKVNNLMNVTIEHHNEAFMKWVVNLECPNDYRNMLNSVIQKYLILKDNNIKLKKIDVKHNSAKKIVSKIKQPVIPVQSVELFSITDILNKYRG